MRVHMYVRVYVRVCACVCACVIRACVIRASPHRAQGDMSKPEENTEMDTTPDQKDDKEKKEKKEESTEIKEDDLVSLFGRVRVCNRFSLSSPHP